jgi:regulatory protein
MESEFSKALNYSFRLLKLRARSCREIESRLKLKKYPAQIAVKVRDYLLERGYLDDLGFSRIYVLSRQNKGWGRRRIEAGLIKLGVAEEIYREFLPGKEESREKLRELIERKSAYYKGKKDSYRKLVRFLIFRGFEPEDVFREMENPV